MRNLQFKDENATDDGVKRKEMGIEMEDYRLVRPLRPAVLVGLLPIAAPSFPTLCMQFSSNFAILNIQTLPLM
jgi:hypothetical protein